MGKLGPEARVKLEADAARNIEEWEKTQRPKFEAAANTFATKGTSLT